MSSQPRLDHPEPFQCAGCGRTVTEVSPGEASGLCVACWHDGGGGEAA